MNDVTDETYDELATTGHVLLDIWGPDCRPCIAMMPAVEELAARYDGRVKVLKLEGPEHRQLCRRLRVAGMPTYITMRDGGEVERLTGNGDRDRRPGGRDRAAVGRGARRGPARPRAPRG